MKQKSGSGKAPAEQVLKDIRRQTRRHYSAEEKIRIVLEGLRGEENISELCRREGIAASMYYGWSKEFLEAGKRRLAGDTARAATSGEVKGSSPGGLSVEGSRGRSHPRKPLAQKNVWLAPSASVLLIWLINLHQRIRSQERILAKMELRAFRSS
jgi:transposase